jgi:hypothetical protein
VENSSSWSNWVAYVVIVLFLIFIVFLMARTMMLFSTLTLMPISRVMRRIQRLFVRDRS